jgi:hypothetical protein
MDKMFKMSECSKLDCLLMGMIVVLILCLVFNPMREKFDTSLATRTQVGDAINLDTVSGQSGFLPGDVYDCNTPILMVEPDNAWTWGDSKNYMSDESLAHLHPSQMEAMAPAKMSPQERNRRLAATKGSPVFLAPAKDTFIKGVPNQYQVFNNSDNVMNRRLTKEGFAEHLKRSNEGFDTHQSESTLAAVMQGYSPTAVVPPQVVRRIQKQPFTAEMLRGGAVEQKQRI